MLTDLYILVCLKRISDNLQRNIIEACEKMALHGKKQLAASSIQMIILVT
jgi:hypothetical protein